MFLSSSDQLNQLAEKNLELMNMSQYGCSLFEPDFAHLGVLPGAQAPHQATHLDDLFQATIRNFQGRSVHESNDDYHEEGSCHRAAGAVEGPGSDEATTSYATCHMGTLLSAARELANRNRVQQLRQRCAVPFYVGAGQQVRTPEVAESYSG